MTENEAKVLLCQMYLPCFEEKEKQALTMAIQALEEIQQYRAIGLTPQMVKDLIASEKKAHKIALENTHLLDEYQAIGTVEGYKRVIEISKENFRLSMEYKAKVQQYESIGTVEEFKALKEKNESKKALRIPDDDTCIYYGYYCPCCNEPLSNTTRMKRCFCGQKLDWSE